MEAVFSTEASPAPSPEGSTAAPDTPPSRCELLEHSSAASLAAAKSGRLPMRTTTGCGRAHASALATQKLPMRDAADIVSAKPVSKTGGTRMSVGGRLGGPTRCTKPDLNSPVRARSASPGERTRARPHRPKDMSPEPRVRGRDEHTGQGGGMPSNLNSKLQNLAAQNALLEQQVEESGRARAALERALSEERSRAAADREKLWSLSSRIEQLENTNGSHQVMIDENRELRAQLDLQKVQLEDFRSRAHQARAERGGDVSPPPPSHCLPSPKEQVWEENERLRAELQKSKALLSRYTAELGEIMPGVQAMLSDRHRSDGTSSPSAFTRGPGSVRGVAPAVDTEQETHRPAERLGDRYSTGRVLASSLLLSSSAGGSMTAPVASDETARGARVVERSTSVPSVGALAKQAPASSRSSRASTGGGRQNPTATIPGRRQPGGVSTAAGGVGRSGARPVSVGKHSPTIGAPGRPASGRAASPTGVLSGGAASRKAPAR